MKCITNSREHTITNNREHKPMEECIRVAVRIRPLNEREVACSRAWHHLKSDSSITQVSTEGTPLDPTLTGSTLFTFDKIFGETSSTTEVYEWAVKSVIQSVVRGRNGSIFTYGQTSSGKTYTMQGKGSIHSGITNGGGVVHMAAQDLFSDISRLTDRDFVIRVSVIEIYNEEIRDLLSTESPSDCVLVVREDPSRGNFVNARKHEVVNVRKLFAVLSAGEKNRSVGNTTLNQRSSRSHLMCIVYVEGTPKTKHPADTRSATLTFVDLAGSEGVRHRIDAKVHLNCAIWRRREGSNINKMCVYALVMKGV